MVGTCREVLIRIRESWGREIRGFIEEAEDGRWDMDRDYRKGKRG